MGSAALLTLVAGCGSDEPNAEEKGETPAQVTSVDDNCSSNAETTRDVDVITDVLNERLKFDDYPDAADRSVVGPHASIELQRSAKSTCVTTGSTYKKAPEGSYWLTVEFVQPINRFDDYPVDETPTISAHIDIDGSSAKPDRGLVAFLSTRGQADQKYFSVVVPERTQTVELLMSDGSVQQSISLIDGNRTKEKSIYYAARTEIGINNGQINTGNLNPKTGTFDSEITASFAISAASLSGWQPKIGAAPDGTVWLRLDIDQIKTSFSASVDFAQSLSIVDTSSNVQPGVSTPITVQPIQVGYSADTYLAAAVDENARQFRVLVHPKVRNGSDAYETAGRDIDIQF